MGKRYAVHAPNESNAAPKTLLNIIGSTAIRPRVYDIMIGSSAAPADQAMLVVAGRTTAVGTTAGSAPTPSPLDPGDIAAVCTVGWTHSAEPTYSAVFLLNFGLNQRATFRFVCAPDGELVGTASANNGIALKIHSSTATLVTNGTIHWAE